MPISGGRFTAVPEVGFGVSDTGRDYRLGWRLLRARSGAGSGSPDLSVEARRIESAGTETARNRAPEHRIGFRLAARW